MMMMPPMDWGICLPPPAGEDARPHRPDWAHFPDYSFTAKRRDPLDPDVIPPCGSTEWEKLEAQLRSQFILTHERAEVKSWQTRVLHPEDTPLINAARLVWNGEIADADNGFAPRVWQWEQNHTWWILELPLPYDHAQVRRLMRAQGTDGAIASALGRQS